LDHAHGLLRLTIKRARIDESRPKHDQMFPLEEQKMNCINRILVKEKEFGNALKSNKEAY